MADFNLLDFGGIGIEQIKSVTGFEFARVQQGLAQIGHRLFGGTAFPSAFSQWGRLPTFAQ